MGILLTSVLVLLFPYEFCQLCLGKFNKIFLHCQPTTFYCHLILTTCTLYDISKLKQYICVRATTCTSYVYSVQKSDTSPFTYYDIGTLYMYQGHHIFRHGSQDMVLCTYLTLLWYILLLDSLRTYKSGSV